MAVSWSLVSVGSFAFGLGEAAVGVLVLASAPRQLTNQLLGLLLILEGLGPVGVLYGLWHAEVGAPWFQSAAATVFSIIIVTLHFNYLLFVGQAIPHRSTAWLRQRGWIITIGALWVGSIIYGTVRPGNLLDDPIVLVMMPLQLGVAAFALVAAILLFRATPKGTPTRRRARSYLGAFALRDLALIALPVSQLLEEVAVTSTEYHFLVFRGMLMVASFAMAVNLLRGQILAIDHKVLRASAGALAAGALVLVFIVVSELLEAWLAQGDQVGSIVAAVALAIAFRPVQSACQAGLERWFPAVKPLHQMAHGELESAYAEQVALANMDGVIGAKERAMLDSMAVRLGIDARRAQRIEATALGAQGP